MSIERLDMPVWFQFEVTNRCNFDCAMCPRSSSKVEIRDMPFHLYERLLSGLPTQGLVSLLGLGEPLLHGRIFDMVRLAKRRGNEVSITTNGSLLDHKKRRAVLDSDLDYLRISVDSVESERASSAHRAVERVIENTIAMVKLRGREKRPHLMFNTVVSSDTYAGIADVIRRAREIGIDAVNLIRLARNTPTVHRLPRDLEEALFPAWHQLGNEIGIEVRSTYQQRETEWRYCPLWVNYIYINLHGDVTPCCHLPDRAFAVGNLLNQSPREIWHGEKLRLFWELWFPRICRDCTLMTWRSPGEMRGVSERVTDGG